MYDTVSAQKQLCTLSLEKEALEAVGCAVCTNVCIPDRDCENL